MTIYEGYSVEVPRQVSPSHQARHDDELTAQRDATAQKLAELHRDVMGRDGTFVFRQLLPELGYASSGGDRSDRIVGHVLYLVASFPNEASPAE